MDWQWLWPGHKRKGGRHDKAPWKIPSTSRRDTYADEVFNNFCSSLPKPEDDRQARDHGHMKQFVGDFVYTTLASFRQENNQLHLQIRQLEIDQAKASRSFDQSIEQERRQSRRLEEKHNADLQSIQRKYNDHLSAEHMRCERQVADANNRHAVEKDSMNRNHAVETESLKRNHSVVKNRLERDVSCLKNSLAVLQATSEEEKQEMTTTHNAAIESLKSDFSRQQTELQRAYHSREEALAAQIEELSGALVTRDDDIYTAKSFTISAIPQKSDEKLRGSFSEVVKAVDDLSRLPWRHNQRAFAEADLTRLRGQSGERLLKKAILQDLLWSCLYELLFASPFRMLGEEGHQLEKEWVNQSGRGAPSDHQVYVWPDPGLQTERWRYMTLYQCREILVTPKVFEWDARARVKNGFGATQDNLTKTILALIDGVAETTPQTPQAVEGIVKKASRMWLDFGMQRCRIVVDLTGSGSRAPDQRLAAVRQGGLVLTTWPRLGRFGNMKGADLGTFTIIGGCDGEAFETV